MDGPVHVVTKPIVCPFPLYADFFTHVGDHTVVRWISKSVVPFSAHKSTLCRLLCFIQINIAHICRHIYVHACPMSTVYRVIM